MNPKNEQETITVEELRRQIKGNLAIAADSWPLHQLRQLEDTANDLAMAGLFAEGLLYNGIMSLFETIYDDEGRVKLTSDPDDDNNVFRVLAKLIAENKSRRKAEDDATAKDEPEADENPKSVERSSIKDNYSKFF